MKKLISIITAVTVFAGSAIADEGMWLLPLLEKMNAKALKEAGCEITPKKIMDLKDAVVQFGNGCTGEIVSDKGLLLTNHHCGYSHIQKLSTVEHDYLKDGYWAMKHSEELPCEGLTVKFLESMEDVTHVIAKADSAEAAIEKLEKEAEAANPHCTATVTSFYDGNVYYLIIYKVYKDIRFVGAPPSSIGKFGADTDNWMWPRHTGDFSIFRVYSSPDGSPAEYSADNVPLHPKRHLPICVNGVEEGDFTMILGYPGRTTRFQTSPELRNQIATNDIRIAARTVRQNVLLEDMLADPKVKIQYASKYSGSSNGWKKWQGMKLAFEKLDIIGRAEQEEAAFAEWVNANKKRTEKYGTVLADLKAASSTGFEENCIYQYMNESLARIELVSAGALSNTYLNSALREGLDTASALKQMNEKMEAFYKDYSVSTDRKVAKAMMKFYRDNVDSAYYPEIENFAQMDIDSYVDNLFDSSIFTAPERLADASVGQIRNDASMQLLTAIRNKFTELSPAIREGNRMAAAARKNYTAGLLEWKKGEPSYPDANFTMRLTYGNVKGYSPRDGVVYKHYTTLDGVMEKEDPDNWEFVVPEKLKELWKNQKFSWHAMEDGKMPVAFLSNNDITGGNSGSPVLNAEGFLVGIAFDGNWESMSSDVMFEPDLQRCINVDIKYVLFIIDMFGEATWLVDEMDVYYIPR